MSMSRYATAVFFLFVLFPVFSHGDSGPRIRFEKTTIDYGKVPVGQIVSPRFLFKNTGHAPLLITNRFGFANFIQGKVLEGC